MQQAHALAPESASGQRALRGVARRGCRPVANGPSGSREPLSRVAAASGVLLDRPGCLPPGGSTPEVVVQKAPCDLSCARWRALPRPWRRRLRDSCQRGCVPGNCALRRRRAALVLQTPCVLAGPLRRISRAWARKIGWVRTQIVVGAPLQVFRKAGALDRSALVFAFGHVPLSCCLVCHLEAACP